MIIVIIAGGSGTRLWPLSTHEYPKHLLKLTNDRSLLQNTYDRVKTTASDENIFVIPEASHVDHVYNQLPEIPRKNILYEPARRGTASCIILALSEIKKRNLDDQAIFFLWADHVIRDKTGFKTTIELGSKLAEDLKKVVFLGVEPAYASTGMGYIHKGERLENGHKGAFKFKGFVEKPSKDIAEDYFESGEYLWNTGYSFGTLATFEREIRQHNQRLWGDYQALLTSKDTNTTYLKFESEAIDYALWEHIKDGALVQGAFDWVDIGSFHDLHGISRQDAEGNYIKGEKIQLDQVTNSYIRNEQGIPIAVIGLDNIAVVATEKGILVTNRSHAQKVGDIAKRLQDETR